nr:hypothetical protein [Actinomycetales bacterium]
QPAIAQWNLARFGETLLPLIAKDPKDAVAPVTEELSAFAGAYAREIGARMAARFGLPEQDRQLVEDALGLLHRHRVDYTKFFRRLARGTADELFAGAADWEPATGAAAEALRATEAAGPPDFRSWHARWRAAVGDRNAAAERMNAVNPAYIPRNHVVESALASAGAGDLAPLERLLVALRNPFEDRAELADLGEPPPSGSGPHVTYCGT